MTREEVFEKVKEILVETLSVDADKVTMEARFQEDLETDSLDLDRKSTRLNSSH